MKSQFLAKNPVLPIEKFPSLVLPRNAIMLQLIIQFLLYYLSTGHLREVRLYIKYIKSELRGKSDHQVMQGGH